MQVEVSPYFHPNDFSALRQVPSSGPVDTVSIADILRNAFVCPPHSIYRGVGVASAGFNSAESSGFSFPFASEKKDVAAADDRTLVSTYHRLLTDAVGSATKRMRAPWFLQSAGKDSTSLAIALAGARRDAVCLTYLGGREENEIASASRVCSRLGLRHATLECDPGRAYDRYLTLVPQMPLLTADFALLGYADLALEAKARGADGLIDGLGSDCYFGMPTPPVKRVLLALARRWRWPNALLSLPWSTESFRLSYLLGTLQMGEERHFPGSRFSDRECDALLGQAVAQRSRARLETFRVAARRPDARHMQREIFTMAVEAGAGFAKGIYIAHAAGLEIAYPYCDAALRRWVCQELPGDKRSRGQQNKVLVRDHIATRFGALPYVDAQKGSFRFDLVGLAAARFERVLAFAEEARSLVPGAEDWLKQNHRCLSNKFHASRFYLLAVALPWLISHAEPHEKGSATNF